jgi:dethiobiotin synthetase
MRYFITGTDTGVGKTRATAALAAAFVQSGRTPTIVKPIQTGLLAGVPGDAADAAALAGCPWRELVRFALPADPWSAALAEGRPPLEAAALARRLDDILGPLIVEGAGGIAVPFNATETFATFAAHAKCEAVVAVGLRLGCINHTLLTLAYLAAHAIPVRGVVLIERWRAVDHIYRERNRRAIAAHAPILGLIEHDADAKRSVAQGAAMFAAALDLNEREPAAP